MCFPIIAPDRSIYNIKTLGNDFAAYLIQIYDTDIMDINASLLFCLEHVKTHYTLII